MKKITAWLTQEILSANGTQQATIRAYQPGQTIFSVGDPGEYMAVLLTGSIEIRKVGKILSIVEPGSIFGEMGLIDRQPRIADAIALASSRVAEIREGQFMALMEKTPFFAIEIMRLLTDRMRHQAET